MALFTYKGFDSSGKRISGSREADNGRSLKNALRREGIFVTELQESVANKREDKNNFFAFKFMKERVAPQDLAMATRQMATLVGSGIPLVDALGALVDQIDDKNFKAVWGSVKQQVNEGVSFGNALAEFPRIFSNIYVNMVRAGETSGALDVVLNRLADFTESQAKLRSKLVGTMVYPIVMLVMALGVTAMMFVVVIPKISTVFESQHMALPLPTRILMAVSSFGSTYWWVVILLGLGGLMLWRRFLKTEKGRMKWDRWMLLVPVFGPLIRMVAISRFCKTLATLIGSGVPLLNAFDIVKNVMQNVVLLKAIENARECVKEGESIAAPLKRSGQFPPLVVHMISIGETSGHLEVMLNNICDSYDVQIDARLQAMTSLLEPVIIVVMGVVIACIVFAILMPMLQMSAAV